MILRILCLFICCIIVLLAPVWAQSSPSAPSCEARLSITALHASTFLRGQLDVEAVLLDMRMRLLALAAVPDSPDITLNALLSAIEAKLHAAPSMPVPSPPEKTETP